MSSSSPKVPHFTASPNLVPRHLGDITDSTPDVLRFEARARVDRDLKPYGQKPSLVASADGRITRILLTIPAYAVNHPLAAGFQDLISKLPQDTELLVLTEETVAATVESWLGLVNGKRRVQMVKSNDAWRFSVWAEDAYASVKDQDTIYLVEPLSFLRRGDGRIADFLRERRVTGIEQTQVPVFFEGGNLLVGDDFVLIGVDSANKTLRYMDTPTPAIAPKTGEYKKDAVRRLFGYYLDHQRTIAYVGTECPVPESELQLSAIDGRTWIEELFSTNSSTTKQPIFHIDMFLTLAGRAANGKYRLLVGDPAMAAQILKVPVWPHAMAKIFDDIAKDLGQRGFEVIRNPLPLAYYAYDGTEAWTRAKVQTYVARSVKGAIEVLRHMEANHLDTMPARVWYFATANNALVQYQPSSADVWLPSYGYGNFSELTVTDKANQDIWKSLRYTVHALGDFHPFALGNGAVHCIKKYLDRQ